MACNQYTLGPRTVDSSVSIASIFALRQANALLISLQPSIGCQDTIDLVNPQLTEGPNGAVVPDNYVLTLADIIFGATVGGGGQVTLTIDGVGYGFWAVSNSGGGPVVVDNTTYGPTINFAAVNQVDLLVNTGTPTFSLTMNPIINHFDAAAYIACLIPACAVSTPLPQVGGAVKSANYTKLFNPLGLSLKDI